MTAAVFSPTDSTARAIPTILTSPKMGLDSTRAIWVVAAVLSLHVLAIWALQFVVQKQPADTTIPVKFTAQIIELPKPIPPPVTPPPPPTPPIPAVPPQPAPKPAAAKPAETKPVAVPEPAKPLEVKAKLEPAKTEPQKQAEPQMAVVESSKPAVAETTPAPAAENVITSPNSAATTSAAPTGNTGSARVGSAAGTGVNPIPAPTKPNKVSPSTVGGELTNANKTYPSFSRRMGEQGSVFVRFYVNPDGAAENAEVERSSGFERLDQAALTFVQESRYIPGTIDGVPTRMLFSRTVIYKIDR